MGIADIITETVEGIAGFIGDVLHNNMTPYCEIETADSKYVLVNGDGTLVSGIRISGMIRAVGAEEFEQVATGLVRSLQSYLAAPGHTIQIYFSRDPDNTKATLASATAGSRNTARRLGLDVDDVLDSRVNHLTSFCADEEIFIGVWTRPTVLTAKELQLANSKRKQALKNVPAMDRSGQFLFAAYPEIREKHSTLVQNLEADLQKMGFSCATMTGQEMLRAARRAIDPEFTSQDWTPCLPGDPVPRMLRKSTTTSGPRPLDISDIQYPPIPWQVFPRDGERIGTKYMTIGDRTYAPLFIEQPQSEVIPFRELFEKLEKSGLPWRFSFLLNGGGMRYVSIKNQLAKFLKWASPMNGLINESIELLETAAVDESVVQLKMSVCTWAPAGDIDTLRRRASRLAHAVSTWGKAELREVSGDPMAGLVSTTPFISSRSIATSSVAPLSHIVRLLPMMRPASPWPEGGILYRTRDGKLMPFQPGSSLQTTWNYILFALPGFGKSVQMASILFASCIQSGIKRLPRIGILDIGPSSRGLISLVREALPESQRHYACHFKIRMTPEYAINPGDTQLGARYPTPTHRAMLVNLLTQLATPPERTEAYESMSQVATKVVDFLYSRLSDEPKASPRRYSAGAAPKVDALLANYGFTIDRMTTWWSIVDFLFDKGHIHEASIAQRYAMPLISEAPAAAKEQAIVDLYQNVKIETGESLNDAFARLISDALREYPILSEATRFDIGDVRIAAIDIDEVAKSGSKSAERQTAIMYLLADFILTKDFKLDPDIVSQFPERYRAYQSKRILEIKEDMKWIAYDEFHRTSSSFAVQNQVIVNMREGRKWNIGVILASQGIEDFPPAAKEFATGYFILNSGTEKNANALQQLLGFNDTAKQLLIDYATGPGPAGAPFLAHFTTKRGTFTQLLFSTIGPIENWAFSTTMEDALVRDRVSAVVGPVRARALCAKKHPMGAKEEVERIRIKASELAVSVDAIKEVTDSILAQD